MLTENTKHAFLCIELVDETRTEDFEAALNELSGLVTENLGGTAKISILDINHKELEIA